MEGWLRGRGPLGRGDELKRALVRASIGAADAVLSVDPRARIVVVDPIIRVFPASHDPDVVREAAGRQASQYHAWDMIAGHREPELRGSPRYLDIVGVHYYVHNQWQESGEMLDPADPRRRSLRELLHAVRTRARDAVTSSTAQEERGARSDTGLQAPDGLP